jgi:hypothetical protein
MKLFGFAVLAFAAVAPGLAFAQTGTGLTAMHARSAMTDFGCSGITTLGVAADGGYYAQCMKGGRTINVMMDKSGAVSEAMSISHITEGRARYELTAFGCSSISALGAGPGGSWYGMCYKGGAATNVMVDGKGVAAVATPAHVTDSVARSVLTDYGCSSITALDMSSSGSWVGQCSKGGVLKTVMVGSDSKVTSN